MTDSERAYRQLLENVPDAIAFRFREGEDGLRYTHAAGQGFERIGFEASAFEGRRVGEGRPADLRETLREHYRRALDGERSTLEVDAEGRCYRLLVFPITDGSGDVVAGGGIARDVTERLVYERELERQTERLESVLRTASHDLRNPLAVASQRADLLSEESDSEHVAPLVESLDRIESLVDRMLASEYRVAEDATDLDLADVARTAWRNVTTGDATLSVDADREVRADEGDLQRLFENLFRNSVEHGSTDSRTQSDDAVEHAGSAPGVRVGTLDDGFYVEDDGPGIPAERRERVFDRDYSGTPGGTGLGLFIVDRIAEAHGWDVAATESADGGARFEFTGVDD